MNWGVWLRGLAAAAIGGAATGTTQAVTASGTVNTTTAITAASGALVTVLAYLMKSPLGAVIAPPTVDPTSAAPR